MLKRFLGGNFCCLLAFLFAMPLFALDLAQPYSERSEVQKFVKDIHKKHGLDSNKLRLLFAAITPDKSVITAMSKPFEEVPWYRYRERFVTDERANAGLDFWEKNKAAIDKAEKQFGIPAEIIVAIIGVETYYGRNVGKHPVLRSLATLAFDYPPRAKFFRSELEQFLLLSDEEGLDPKTTLGSYAGAMGTPQFIASSYRRYAVDFSGTGRRDLINDTADAIGSVANYFKQHGWRPQELIATKASLAGKGYEKLTMNSKNPKPSLTLTEFSKYNVKTTNPKISKNTKAALVVLQNKNGKEYWLGLNNFYVITRYNHSANYAMAVFQLSERIKALHNNS